MSIRDRIPARFRRATPSPMDVLDEGRLFDYLGVVHCPAGYGLTDEQLDAAEDWYRSRLQSPPAWIRERRADNEALHAALVQARETNANMGAVQDAFEDRLAVLDDRIATSARHVVDHPKQAPQDGDVLERINETLGDHTHVWDKVDPLGRPSWQCSCDAIKCDLPRCIRARHTKPPHHMRS